MNNLMLALGVLDIAGWIAIAYMLSNYIPPAKCEPIFFKNHPKPTYIYEERSLER